jgi:hypothetical protein
LKSALLRDEKERMKTDTDLASLGNDELVTLVQQLRQQLAERDREIERLKNLLSAEQATSATDEAPSAAVEEPAPGSQEGLLAQLEKIYPEGR